MLHSLCRTVLNLFPSRPNKAHTRSLPAGSCTNDGCPWSGFSDQGKHELSETSSPGQRPRRKRRVAMRFARRRPLCLRLADRHHAPGTGKFPYRCGARGFFEMLRAGRQNLAIPLSAESIWSVLACAPRNLLRILRQTFLLNESKTKVDASQSRHWEGCRFLGSRQPGLRSPGHSTSGFAIACRHPLLQTQESDIPIGTSRVQPALNLWRNMPMVDQFA